MRQIVYLEWEDPTSQDAWTEISEAEELICYQSKSCGMLIAENEKHICISLSVIEESQEASDYITIPKTHILKRVNLGEI